MIVEFHVTTVEHTEFVKITDKVQSVIDKEPPDDRVCTVYVPHTTAGITINEGADPDVIRDIMTGLDKIVPWEAGYLHSEGDSAAHLKASIMGSSASVFVEDGQLLLGTWQHIFLCEFDGPRSRRILVGLTDR